MTMKLVKWISAGVLGAAAQFALAAGLPGPLVTPQWLHEHLNEVTIVDVRDDLKAYSAEPKFEVDKKTGKKTLAETGGHIPGAVLVDFGKIRQERTVDGVKIKAQLPTADYFTKAMDDSGLNKIDKPAILNGGMNAYLQAGFPVSTDKPSAAKGNWVATGEDKNILATMQDVKAGLHAGNIQFVDARQTSQ